MQFGINFLLQNGLIKSIIGLCGGEDVVSYNDIQVEQVLSDLQKDRENYCFKLVMRWKKSGLDFSYLGFFD